MDVRASLVDLGFTSLESAAYCELVKNGPATAYRVAKSIGRPTANTYQALAALLQRGAVALGDGDRRIYRAVEPETFLEALAAQFSNKRARAAESLRDLRRQEPDNRIYQLANVGQVMEQAREIIGAASEILLFDMFPQVLLQLSDELSQANRRGVLVAGLVYANCAVAGAALARSSLPSSLLARWPGQQLTVVADASRYLHALLSDDLASVSHAFSSDSAYLACLQHSGLSAEIRLAALREHGDDRLSAISLLQSYPDGLSKLVGPKVSTWSEICN